MTRTELALGSMIFVAVIAAGIISVKQVDRHFAAAEARGPAGTQGPCVDAEGSWKNWLWPNVPTLSPKCRPEG
jgi:hypothetical protein